MQNSDYHPNDRQNLQIEDQQQNPQMLTMSQNQNRGDRLGANELESSPEQSNM